MSFLAKARTAAIAAVLSLAYVATVTAQDQTGTIVFYREPHAMTGYFKPMLFCDGLDLAEIENGTYFQVTAPAGAHRCAAESLERPVVEVNVPMAGTAYVHVKLLSGLHDHVVLVNALRNRRWSGGALVAITPKFH